MKKIFFFIKSKIWFFAAFMFNKGLVFVAPLFVSEILSKEEFGILEYGLAGLGMVVNSLISLGVQSGYPFFKLINKSYHLFNAFDLHYVWLFFFFISSQIAYFVFDIRIEYYMALNIAYILSNQIYISTQLKTDSKIIKAVFFDSGVYLILFLFSILAFFDIVPSSINFFNKILLVYASSYSVYALLRILKVKKQDIFKNYFHILKYTLPVLLGGLLIYFLTVSGRIFLEYFLKDFEIVGIYSFYFRLAAIVIVIYQVINIVFFKQMYKLEPKILDSYFSLSFFLLYVVSIGFFLITPLIVPYFSSFYNSTVEDNIGVHFLLSAQMIFWIATALLSNIIDREKLAGKNNIYFILLLILFVSLLYITESKLNLELFVIFHLLTIFIASIIQIKTLSRKKIYFKKTAVILVFLNVITFIIYYLSFNN
jgi:O-antigen/teichoic acid export membrane protein